ncbi:MAG: putative mitomycin resistance protein [Cyanobacteria bacterium RYN_339]|nr:putative mitomycin resistance protein [Cyanobacteria bacterium RYN_339]
MVDKRKLGDLAGIGKAMLKDFERLDVKSVEQLAGCDGLELYQRIGAMDGQLHDPCVLDTYRCAIAQARDPGLPAEQRKWWWWSRQRLAEKSK